MYLKNGRYYADWRTPDGRRHRKSFPTALGAKRHETKQRTQAPREARSAAAVLESRKPHGSEPKPASSDESPERQTSPASAKDTSKQPSRRGRKAVSLRGTPTRKGSERSCAHSLRSARQTSVCASRESLGRSHVRSGRPRTKRVGVFVLQTSDSAGCSLVRSMSLCDTKQPSNSRQG